MAPYPPSAEKAMAPHSSTLAWKIPWTEEPGRLQSMGHEESDATKRSLSLFTFMHWRRKWQPTQCSCLENPRDEGAWWAAVYGVAHDWSDLAAAAAFSICARFHFYLVLFKICLSFFISILIHSPSIDSQCKVLNISLKKGSFIYKKACVFMVSS